MGCLLPRAGELTVNCTFDPSIHLTIQDLQVDAEVNPSSLQVRIKSSKTNPFRQGCFIYLGRGQASLCPISAILAYLHLRGPSSGPFFIDTHGQPLTRSRLSSFIQSVLQGAGIPGSFQATVFALGPPRQLRNPAFQITLSRPWAGGPVMHINSTLEPLWNQFWKFLGGCFSNRYLIKGDIGFGRYGLGRLQATSPFSEP